MKRTFKFISSIIAAAVLCVSAGFAQVSSSVAEQAYKLMESTDDVLAYHGDYSATITLQIQKPGKPDKTLKYKIYERTDKDLMTILKAVRLTIRPEKTSFLLIPASRKALRSSLRKV